MIDLKELIKEGVDFAIDKKYGNKLHLYQFLIEHPRRKLLEFNLRKELHANRYLDKRARNNDKNNKIIKDVIHDFTYAFCDFAIMQKKNQINGK